MVSFSIFLKPALGVPDRFTSVFFLEKTRMWLSFLKSFRFFPAVSFPEDEQTLSLFLSSRYLIERLRPSELWLQREIIFSLNFVRYGEMFFILFITFLLPLCPLFLSFCRLGVTLATFWLFLVTRWTGGEDS